MARSPIVWPSLLPQFAMESVETAAGDGAKQGKLRTLGEDAGPKIQEASRKESNEMLLNNMEELMNKLKTSCLHVLGVMSVLSGALSALAQGTAFTYQGQLQNSGGPANGTYNLSFALYTASIGGAAIAAPITNYDVGASNGLFTTTIDFGAAPWNGQTNWLEIRVAAGGTSFIVLAPRQLLAPSPYAITAGTLVSNGLAAGTYANVVTFANSANEFNGSYSGNGAGLTNVSGTISAQTVSSLTVQAVPNARYILTNNSQTTVITLPAAPNFGDIVGIANSGLGSWQLGQNPGQSVLANTLVGASALWTLSGAPTNKVWDAIAASANGSTIIASEQAAALYLSADGGITWTYAPFPVFAVAAAVTISSDGSRAAVAVPNGPIYISGKSLESMPFPGTNWAVSDAPITNWSGIASSTDGSHVAAVVDGGGIYLSSDFGSNLVPSLAPSNNWTAVASSADGSHLAATFQAGVGDTNGGIYLSSNFGTNWSPANTPTNLAWFAVASSYDGTRLIAAAGDGIYVSIDSGTTWGPVGGPTSALGIACSADGTRIVAAAGASGMFVSFDGGTTWSAAALPVQTLKAVASTASGTFLAGAHLYGGIYLSQTATTVGPRGHLSGGAITAVELQYVGNGQFLPINHEGTLLVH